jgi:hypothetical protein
VLPSGYPCVAVTKVVKVWSVYAAKNKHLRISFEHVDGRRNTDRTECIVCAEERKELSLPAAAGGLKTMGYGRMAKHRPGGVFLGGHSPSHVA